MKGPAGARTHHLMTSHSVIPSPISASLNFCSTLRDAQTGAVVCKWDIRIGRPTRKRSGLVSNMVAKKKALGAKIRFWQKRVWSRDDIMSLFFVATILCLIGWWMQVVDQTTSTNSNHFQSSRGLRYGSWCIPKFLKG